MGDSQEDKGYTVKDRRLFSQEEGEDKKAAPEPSQEASKPPEGNKRSAEEEKKQQEIFLPPVDFATFIFSLNTSALVHLGEISDPSTGRKEKQLTLAKHTIDTIAILDAKTKGNLTKDEQDLIDHVLYDLRMRYVREVTK